MGAFNESVSESVLNSTFTFLHDGKLLEIDNAVCFWRNFSGHKNRFGNEAKHFNVALTEDVAKILIERGVNVKEIIDKDTGKSMFKFIDVKVNMTSAFPPIITMYTDFNGERSHNALDASTISILDTITFESADCTINFYNPEPENKDSHVSCYLRKLNVIHKKSIEFNGKYDNWDSPKQEDTTTVDPDKNAGIDGSDIDIDNEAFAKSLDAVEKANTQNGK